MDISFRAESYDGMATPAISPFLTEQQAAARLQLSPRALRNWRNLSQGPAALKLGGAIRFDITLQFSMRGRLGTPPNGSRKAEAGSLGKYLNGWRR